MRKENLRVAVLVPAYKRPEFTLKCIKALEEAQEYNNVTFYLWDDGSNDGTFEIFEQSTLPKIVMSNKHNHGLRNVLIDFITDAGQGNNYDIIGVIGNDCGVPKNWLNDLLTIFNDSDVQILSPNVFPSNAAMTYGRVDNTKSYMPSSIVGGLWFMYTHLVKGLVFDNHDVSGITGAFNILKQIIIEKEPIVGWADKVIVQDMGHWSGKHQDFIRSPAHMEYYQEVGRKVE
jgi:glycosyltransferase involved in cell wall biosynthesis